MGRQVTTALGLVFAVVMSVMVWAQIDTLQDTGEAATTGTVTSLLQTVTPITMILFAGGLAVVLLIAAVSLLRGLSD